MHGLTVDRCRRPVRPTANLETQRILTNDDLIQLTGGLKQGAAQTRWIDRALGIKAGKIYPPPVEVGRAYYVEENATFADGRTRPRLVDRIPK